MSGEDVWTVGVEGAVEAVRLAFEAGEPVGLYLSTVNGPVAFVSGRSCEETCSEVRVHAWMHPVLRVVLANRAGGVLDAFAVQVAA